eukprot:354166-Pyramimonas_sp.AAC.1
MLGTSYHSETGDYCRLHPSSLGALPWWWVVRRFVNIHRPVGSQQLPKQRPLHAEPGRAAAQITVRAARLPGARLFRNLLVAVQ